MSAERLDPAMQGEDDREAVRIQELVTISQRRTGKYRDERRGDSHGPVSPRVHGPARVDVISKQ